MRRTDDLDAVSVHAATVVGRDNANIDYVALQRYGRGVKHFSIQHVTVRRDARVGTFNVQLGADLARADVSSRLAGPGSDSEMLALWIGDHDQHFDHHTLQHHQAPHAHSDLLFKGALTDRSRSVFRGLIRVDEGAQLTDAYQTNRNLLLSDKASATSLPNLEIKADDVRCSHGATIGQVEASQLFYLMSRGLTRERAERLLVVGFVDEVLGRIPMAGVRERVLEAIEEKTGA
jgi:Fe-S cluster assembly protein SufD